MNRYTISPDFLEHCAREKDYYLFLNVLLVFAQNNSYKICLDKSELAFNCYKNLIQKYDMLASWMKYLNDTPYNIEAVCIPDADYGTEQELFMAIANAIPPEKKLVTFDKSLYTQRWLHFLTSNGIHLLDGNETEHKFRQLTIVQVSFGDYSPNTVGNQNTINHDSTNITRG